MDVIECNESQLEILDGKCASLLKAQNGVMN